MSQRATSGPHGTSSEGSGQSVVEIEEFMRRSGATHIYHFTPLANIPSIRDRGLWPLRDLRDAGIDTQTGGDELSNHLDHRRGLDQFVHLSFVRGHPMLPARCPAIGKFRSLRVDVRVLEGEGVYGCRTIANTSGSTIMRVKALLDWEDLAYLYNSHVDTSQRDHWKMWGKVSRAQVLVHGRIPPSLIDNV